MYQLLGIDLILIEKDHLVKFVTGQNEVLNYENDLLKKELEKLKNAPRLKTHESIAPIPGIKSWREKAAEYEQIDRERYKIREREKKELEASKPT